MGLRLVFSGFFLPTPFEEKEEHDECVIKFQLRDLFIVSAAKAAQLFGTDEDSI